MPELEGNVACAVSSSALPTARSVYAECGGLMYLGSGIRTLPGEHMHGGIFRDTTVMHKRLTHLVTIAYGGEDTSSRAGECARGHQFSIPLLREGALTGDAFSVRKGRTEGGPGRFRYKMSWPSMSSSLGSTLICAKIRGIMPQTFG